MSIIATDKGDPPLSASVLVTVAVDDVNEFAPEFQYSKEDFPDGVYTVETLSTARAGQPHTIHLAAITHIHTHPNTHTQPL